MKRLLILLALGACTADITGGTDTPTPDAAPVAMMPGEMSVARAQLWVDAMVPYCQAPNHQPDYDAACSSTCTRPDVPDWDPYRSDCSGFVSWAWDLPAPGRVTSTFAPFKTDITHVIDGSELRPGDAINNSEHIMLFKEWVTPGMTAKFLEEPGCSASQPYAREITADVTITGHTVDVKNRATYTAIRYDAAP